MPKRSTLQQRVVFHIQRTLTDDALVQESVLFPDRSSGDNREVDVVIRKKIGEHEVIISIECRDHKRKATVEWVEQMAMKHNLLPTSKLVLVSSSGFTSTAEKKAASLGIDVYSFEEATKTDWNELIGVNDEPGFYLWAFRIVGCGLVFTENPKFEYSANPHIPIYDSLHGFAGTLNDIVRARTVKSSGFVDNAVKYAQQESESIFGAEIRIKPSFFVEEESGKLREIKVIRVYIEAREPDSTVDLKAIRYHNLPVAYGSGASPVGEFEITLVQAKDGVPGGAMSVKDPNTGDIQTVDVRFKEEGNKLVFLTESISVKSKKRLTKKPSGRKKPRR